MGIILIKYADFKRDAEELLPAHWSEVASRKDVRKLAPAHDMYEELERLGKLFVVASYHMSRMNGYSVNVLSPHPHSVELIVAGNDAIYVHPEYRHSGLGGILIEETEKTARLLGAHMMTWHVKPDSSLEKLIAQREGYLKIDHIYGVSL